MSWHHRSVVAVAALMSLAGVVAVSGCAPVVRTHGHIWRNVEIGQIEVGVDNRDSVASMLGTPSATGINNDSLWIYASSRTVSLYGGKPEVTERRVVALEFDEAGTVAWIEEFSLEDGVIVPISERKTPTAGRDLNVLQQFLGNVGRFESPSQ